MVIDYQSTQEELSKKIIIEQIKNTNDIKIQLVLLASCFIGALMIAVVFDDNKGINGQIALKKERVNQ